MHRGIAKLMCIVMNDSSCGENTICSLTHFQVCDRLYNHSTPVGSVVVVLLAEVDDVRFHV